MTTPRVAGHRGRKPRSETRIALKDFSAYLKYPLPAVTYPVDVRGTIGNEAWGMLGNGPDPTCTVAPNGVGDCGFAGRQHLRMAKAARYNQTETWETSDELVTEYLAYDNGQDDGVSLPDVLLAWYKAGKILGFAPVDHTSPAAVDAAMAIFCGVYAGVNLTDDADQLFTAGQPWTTVNGETADPNDGHCIVKVFADGQSLDGWVTWGSFQPATTAWTAACLDEAYVVITTEDEAAQVDMAALTADIQALGGTAPAAGTPAPAPALHPGLAQELIALARKEAEDAKEAVARALHAAEWLQQHGL